MERIDGRIHEPATSTGTTKSQQPCRTSTTAAAADREQQIVAVEPHRLGFLEQHTRLQHSSLGCPQMLIHQTIAVRSSFVRLDLHTVVETLASSKRMLEVTLSLVCNRDLVRITRLCIGTLRRQTDCSFRAVTASNDHSPYAPHGQQQHASASASASTHINNDPWSYSVPSPPPHAAALPTTPAPAGSADIFQFQEQLANGMMAMPQSSTHFYAGHTLYSGFNASNT